ncbi:phosphotransferase family protein [Sulfitobacter alexandrii]|uniref:Phosphotransferase family protein n=1 Tax=Sulfitobacter alexandrii TaxID=1917485 RepID=A0A1J0WDJ3_9RHOB|nr:phosphotransferase family protein [Sulfitobacter alexandrii]APE42391.1 phosphotransferase family protein [Sulfitobacter alexandrii]
MQDLDESALADWLKDAMPEGEGLSTRRISGGQSNPTWFVTWGDRELVLRSKPTGPILPGAHAIEREFRVMTALRDTPVPVPRALRLEEDPEVLGAPFYLMERLEGRVLSDCTLPGMTPQMRRDTYLEMARTLARLHAVRPEKVGLEDFGRPGNYFERQIRRWTRQYEESETERLPRLDRLARWLSENTPPDDGVVAIAHGDFRLGNLMYHPDRPEVVGVLDWELSTLGHPLADLGFCVIPWHSSPEEYGGILGTGWEDSGIPTRAEFVEEYFRYSDLDAPLLPFHVAFALFRFAVIFIGIADRARRGNAASDEAEALGPLADRFAARALDIPGVG